MKFLEYIKDNRIILFLNICIDIFIFAILKIFSTPIYANMAIFIILLISQIGFIIYNYLRRRKFYDNLLQNLSKLDQKYLIMETLPEVNTYEEKIIQNCLYDINKSMLENVKKYRSNINEFKEFLELWIHEVKIPIASMVLKCHNNKDKYDKELLSLVRKLDNNIDQVLYYVRAENLEKDFVISEVNIREIVKNVSLKNKNDLLENNVLLDVNISEIKINTDKKWIEFILNQIINNSIKYKKDSNAIIKIFASEEKEKIILEIYDNGIGIPKKDIKRVFEKTFTGTNGRDKIKSTGMGLYIVKNLCNKLGHNVYIESEENNYTKVIIEFGKNDIYKF